MHDVRSRRMGRPRPRRTGPVPLAPAGTSWQRSLDATNRRPRDRVPPDQPATVPTGPLRGGTEERRLHGSLPRALRSRASRDGARARPPRRAVRPDVDGGPPLARVMDRDRAGPAGPRGAAARPGQAVGGDGRPARHQVRDVAAAGRIPGSRRAHVLVSVRVRAGLCRPATPTCPPTPPHEWTWDPPPLILEHYQLRRWLELGVGRPGHQAVLIAEAADPELEPPAQ